MYRWWVTNIVFTTLERQDPKRRVKPGLFRACDRSLSRFYGAHVHTRFQSVPPPSASQLKNQTINRAFATCFETKLQIVYGQI